MERSHIHRFIPQYPKLPVLGETKARSSKFNVGSTVRVSEQSPAASQVVPQEDVEAEAGVNANPRDVVIPSDILTAEPNTCPSCPF